MPDWTAVGAGGTGSPVPLAGSVRLCHGERRNVTTSCPGNSFATRPATKECDSLPRMSAAFDYNDRGD